LKIILLYILLYSLSLQATEHLNIDGKSCSVPKNVMIALLMNESSSKRELGYEYIIRVNGKENIQRSKQVFKALLRDNMIDKIGRDVYDCRSTNLCVKISKYLIENGVKSLDLGSYQMNYYYHPEKLENYFDFDKSYLMACKYQHKLINQYGYSWKTVAMYHSKTRRYNEAYQARLFKNYNKIVNKKD